MPPFKIADRRVLTSSHTSPAKSKSNPATFDEQIAALKATHAAFQRRIESFTDAEWLEIERSMEELS